MFSAKTSMRLSVFFVESKLIGCHLSDTSQFGLFSIKWNNFYSIFFEYLNITGIIASLCFGKKTAAADDNINFITTREGHA